MIICLCQNVSDIEIIKAIREDRVSELITLKCLGAVCGSCVPDIQELISKHSDEHLEEDDYLFLQALTEE